MSKDKDKKDEDNSECKSNKGLEVSFLKKACDSHVLVAALVATILRCRFYIAQRVY